MKSFSLILFFILQIFEVSAQYWAEKSSVWHTGIVESIFSTAQGFIKTEVVGDTLLQGHNCKVLHNTRHYSSGAVLNNGDDYMYESNGKVYHYMNNSFYTLYDFNAMSGDTWIVAVPYPSPFCGISFNLCDTLVEIVVDSVSTMMIQNQILKTMYVHSDSNDWYFRNPVIENIGSVGGLFPFIYDWMDNDIPYLRCYEDSLIFYDTSFSIIASCDSLINSIENIQESNDIKVFPNPITDKLNITLENNQLSEIILYDIASRKILQQQFRNSVTLNTEHLAKGLYIFEVRNKSSLCKKGKVVKD